ncbi:MATE family efflux transporter [bacterium 1xD8-48]|jgi:Na+-driven multidrug efflux pump|nr:MATE family efflux transporter [Lachnospiraceae bacterium]MCI9327901.1 MATE family efflux transporter [Lachnospiraceae bacterium]NBJ99014.1 MATE family efflux transporter [bacterium 1xD8-48]
MKKYNMLTDSPGRSLFFFALPMILGNLFQQFYSTVDSIIVGQYVGEDALAAVGASYSLTTVFIMIAIGGGIGASVVISQYLGAGLNRQMKTSVYTALLSFLGVSIVLGVVGLVFSRNILTALNTPANILEDALLYLDIYFAGLPFLFMYNILSSVFNALGNSKTPLYLLIFSSLLNIVMDLAFVRGLGLGIAGAAVATVIAQGLSAVISFCLLLRALKGYAETRTVSGAADFAEQKNMGEVVVAQRKETLRMTDGKKERPVLFDTAMLGNMIKVAIPSMLQQSIVSIGMLLVQSVVNGFGSSVLAGYTAGTRIESVCIVPMIASGNAVSTFTAQNLGAGKPERVKKGYLAAVKMVAAFAVIICVTLTLFHGGIVGSFLEAGSEPAAFETGNAYLSFIAFFFVCIGLKAITDGVLRGSGDVVVFTLANLINLGIRVSVAFAFAPVWGVQAVWFAIPMGWTTNYLISFVRYLSGKWSRKKLIKTVEEE